MTQQILGNSPSFVFLENQILNRYFDVVEKNLIHFMPAIHQNQRTNSDAWRFHVHQDEADAFLTFLGKWVCANQTKYPVTMLTQSCPNFLAIDHVVISNAFSACFDCRQIRTSTRLGIALHPKVIALPYAR